MIHKNRVSGISGAIFYWMIVNHLNPVAAKDSVVRLNVEPAPRYDEKLDAIISYRNWDLSSYTPWILTLEEFLDAYKTRPRGYDSVAVECDHNRPPPPGKVCDVDVTKWGPCVLKNTFGFSEGSPCIFLELETPPGWEPEFYNDTSSLPAEMPADLILHISDSSRDRSELNTVWVTCEGLYSTDKEYMGPVEYIPGPGFAGYYFTNSRVNGWLNPIIALHFQRPAVRVVAKMKCKAWARNIPSAEHHFSLMIDGV